MFDDAVLKMIGPKYACGFIDPFWNVQKLGNVLSDLLIVATQASDARCRLPASVSH
ncbi:hypothetical protein M3P36_10920 [Altererythrobacter sp. KTW20L]|nr:hypothetical protein [Altererythrobacter sp. KTW20L]